MAKAAAAAATCGGRRAAGCARPRRAAAAPRRARRAAAAAAAELPVCGDVVRVTKGEAAEFGVVVEMGLGSVEVELLEALPEGEDEPLMPGWLDHVETETFQVLRTGEYVVWDDWTYGERMIADRVSNPHGEHAHGFYSIDVSAGEEDGDE